RSRPCANANSSLRRRTREPRTTRRPLAHRAHPGPCAGLRASLARDSRSGFSLREALDVHITEREDPNARNETSGPVHVPHPRIAQLDLETGRRRAIPHTHLDLVGEIEAALCLDDVLEKRENGPVLLNKR